MQPPHVPAWKRLGLKLKYAKDSDDRIQTSAPPSKRGVEDHVVVSGIGTSESPVPNKKRRTELSASPLKTNGYDSGPLSPSLKRSNNGGLKKKVSFTAETKQLDGDSSKSLIAAWEADNQFLEDLQQQHAQMMKDRDAEQSQPQPQPQPPSETETDLKEKETPNAKLLIQPIPKPKRVKGKAKIGELSGLKQEKTVKVKVGGKSADALDYLNQFSQNRTSWKFNKAREVWILKRVLSLDHIPSSYDSVLAEYVQGLKSKGARARLTTECSKIASKEIEKRPARDDVFESVKTNGDKGGKEEEDDMDDPARRKFYHEDARENFKGNLAESLDEQEANGDEEERRELERRAAQKRRARMILENIAPLEEEERGGRQTNGNIHPQRVVFNDDDADTRPGAGPSNGAKRQKQRKKRTGIVSVSDSSSSSSESESDSDSSNDGEAATRTRTGKPAGSAIPISSTEPRDEKDDSTSSSELADSSSSEDDDNDSSSDSDDEESTTAAE